jgi:hypothetical protein
VQVQPGLRHAFKVTEKASFKRPDNALTRQ